MTNPCRPCEVSWSSTNLVVATIDSSGLATTNIGPVLSTGTTTIRATLDGISDTASLTSTFAIGIVRINEVVLEPQQDWNDSGAGGDGIPFNVVPGSAIAPSPDVSSNDQWIEITNSGNLPVLLTGWFVRFTDSGGTARRIDFRDSDMDGILDGLGTSAILGGNQFMVIGDPGDVALDSTITLEGFGLVFDEEDFGAVHGLVGFASGGLDESVARVPNGFDTNQATDFQRRPATIGDFNPSQ